MLNEQIILSGILLYIGNALKSIPSLLLSLILSIIGTSYAVYDSDFYPYKRLDEWILKLNKRSINNHIRMTSTYDTLQSRRKIEKRIGEGKYTVIYDKTLLLITKQKMQVNGNVGSGQSMNEELLIIRLIGFNSYKIRQEIFDYVNKRINNDDKNYIEVYGGTCHCLQIAKRSFDTIYTREKDNIIQFLDKFKNNEQFYYDHGIRYKTGILLHGLPGTGKTSLAHAISSYINYDLRVVDLASCSTINDMKNELDKCDTNEVLLFEDIDCVIGYDRDNPPKSEKEQDELAKRLNLLINFFDGIKSLNRVIFVATTNHKELLDQALIRPGRFDLHVEMNGIDDELSRDMISSFGISDKDIQTQLIDKSFKDGNISPTLLQNNIIQYCNK